MQADAQQPVETGEMVHVRVRHQGVAHAQQLARRERREIAQVEQQRAPSEPEINDEPGIGERLVDQTGLDECAHIGSQDIGRVGVAL